MRVSIASFCCFFRAIGFRALEYFMKGCDETSEERKKGFSVLIQNFWKLEFDLEQHRVRIRNKSCC